MATIKTLLEGDTKIAPRTKVKAVSDDDGNSLDMLLKAKADETEISELKEEKAAMGLSVVDGKLCVTYNV